MKRMITRPVMKRRSMKPTLFLPLAALLALSTLAVTQDAPDAARDQPSAKAQERIVKEVGHQLRMLPYVGPFDYLGARVDGFTVMLFGQVVKPVNKSDAESAVKHIEGVEKVDNRIEVLPPSPMDHGIRRSMYRAIYGYPALQRYSHVPQKPIRIIVKGGHVTLEGVVDSEADKNLAGIRANGVPNVFSVTNNLQVEKP